MSKLVPRSGVCAAALAAVVVAATTTASADVCDDLWYQRNAIFKAAGYCFKTSRGIRAFGNAGCAYDDEADVPLSARQSTRVRQIKADERALGCR
ncbi:YARHG domain-containing protein [Chelatococcus reniformis]|uniref:YARHG domain-containing protein n=1 Tax=Chelatococcus reniformis TaxID=1494448 RepID=A0A916XAX2_9HYPH|nr:YARHG domain-containing protein [Chelatococcus reniformis]GGC57320.1 hypothetical protein GCM10010994_15350 [Chelatococcus reniformis]